MLRKEKSWQEWRDKSIAPVEFDNVPTEGFVLNKGVGGARRSYGWNVRNEYIRVYDPRDFEFEISIANLLFILRECDCNKGKGLEGKFVYAWDKNELVLLPVGCQEFTRSTDFTSLQSTKVAFKDLVPGFSYVTRKQKRLMYLGRYEYHFVVERGGYRATPAAYSGGSYKRHVFAPEGDEKGGFVFLDSSQSLAACVSDTPSPSLGERQIAYANSPNGSAVSRLFLKAEPPESERYGSWCVESSPGVFDTYYTNYRHTPENSPRVIDYIQGRYTYEVVDGVLVRTPMAALSYPPGQSPSYYSYSRGSRTVPWIEPTGLSLYAVLENGAEVRVNQNSFERV